MDDIENNATCGIYALLCKLKLEMFVRNKFRPEIHIEEDHLIPDELKRPVENMYDLVAIKYVTISSIHELIKSSISDLQNWNV